MKATWLAAAAAVLAASLATAWAAGPATRASRSTARTSGAATRPAAPAAAAAPQRPVVMYTKDHAPPTPRVEDLPKKDRVSQYGITWTFDQPVPVGQFLQGDWYVVGPVRVVQIDPAPLFGKDVPADTVDAPEAKAFKPDQYARNGSVLNLPPAQAPAGFDSRMRHDIYDGKLAAHLPIDMKPGDALLSTISKGAFVRYKHHSPIQTLAILTCLKEPAPADAFRPGYGDRRQAIYLARNLKRDLLPSLAPVETKADLTRLTNRWARPWLVGNLFGESHLPYQFSGYGQSICQEVSRAALALCLNYKPEEKELLLQNFCQFGIDVWGVVKGGHPGFPCYGGWNSGYKYPAVFAGVMLGDEKMACPTKALPGVWFQEDEQTAYGRTYRGAGVVFTGHDGIDAKTGLRRDRGRHLWGPYEHLDPSQWDKDQKQSDAYRRCCTSRVWIGETLAIRLMKMEKQWDHDAFLDYCDRWMSEEETPEMKKTQPEWAWQGEVQDKFAAEMWARYRPTLQPPVDAWKKKAPTSQPWEKAPERKGTPTTGKAAPADGD